MNTICIKLENIELDIKEIKDFQAIFMQRMEGIAINSAKYPSPEFVNKTVAKIDKHDTYFTFLGTGLILAWGLLLWVAEKVWR